MNLCIMRLRYSSTTPMGLPTSVATPKEKTQSLHSKIKSFGRRNAPYLTFTVLIILGLLFCWLCLHILSIGNGPLSEKWRQMRTSN